MLNTMRIGNICRTANKFHKRIYYFIVNMKHPVRMASKYAEDLRKSGRRVEYTVNVSTTLSRNTAYKGQIDHFSSL